MAKEYKYNDSETKKEHILMKTISMLASLALVCSCTGSAFEHEVEDSITIAREYVGLHEVKDRRKLNELLNVDPVQTEWCAAFVNKVLQLQGIPNLHDVDYDYPLMARGFLQWGESVDFEDEIRRGDIVIFPRGSEGWQGHVGFYVGTMDGKWIILGGNQDDKVSYKLYPPYMAIGIRRGSPYLKNI